jgi:hypothetical protein
MAPTPSGLSLTSGGCTILNATSPPAIRQCVCCLGTESRRLFVNRRSQTGSCDTVVIVFEASGFQRRTTTPTDEVMMHR